MTPRSTSRRKKTRYLSLRRRLAAAASALPMVSSLPSQSATSDDRVQLDLFPLHPGTTNPDDDPHDEHLSRRFFPSDDAVTLHSLLGPHSSSPAASEDQLSPSSSSANYSACSSSYGSVGGAVAAAGLARSALRGRERWWAEEEEGEAASGGGAGLLSGGTRRLTLKLDYEGILNAWSGERPLFVEGGDGLQVVPDLRHTAVPMQYATVFVNVAGCGGGGGGGGVWTVPDGGSCPLAEEGREGGGSSGGRRAEREEEEEEEDVGEAEGEEEEGKAAGTREDREARVIRYKQKRRHRLFSKRIRYEVRKVNAEKRPRLKGRFVRRDDDV